MNKVFIKGVRWCDSDFSANNRLMESRMIGALMMKKIASALAVLAVLVVLSPLPAAAQSEPTPKELFEGASRMMMQALELLIKTMPQYDAPVVLENGDILIRRKREAPAQPDGVETLSGSSGKGV